MATPSPAPTNPPTSSTSRWAGSGESSSAFTGLSRGRGRGNGRGGRGGRGGGRGGGPSREAKSDADKAAPSQEKPKPIPSKVSTTLVPSDSAERVPSSPRTKNPSRRPSRSTPAPIVTQVSTPSTELQTPSSASRTNRRKRSQNSKPPVLPPKINVVPDNNPFKPALPVVPHTAPLAKDTPPHLANNHSPSSPVEMKSNIDALVERVRAVAMADNRPSTPGSHIDWAGDDDDSLPDLNDWGIPTITPAQTISPIIVDGLKPLPEPIAKPINSPTNISPVKVSSPLTTNVSLPHGRTQETSRPSGLGRNSGRSEMGVRRGNGKGRNDWHSNLAPQPIPASDTTPVQRWGGATPTPPFKGTTFSKEEVKGPEKESPINVPELEAPQTEAVPTSSANVADEKAAPGTGAEASPAPSTGKGLADSIHASTSAHSSLFDGIGNDNGLAASIHAPKASSEASSAPATFPSYNNLPRPPRNDAYTHNRRPASFNSHPRNHRPNNLAPRGLNHTRNHSSPQTASLDGGSHKSPHARPVLTGDAISRLARTIVSTTPKSTPVISTSTE